jgi:hypothetical protein
LFQPRYRPRSREISSGCIWRMAMTSSGT